MRIWALVAIAGLTGCSAMGSIQLEPEFDSEPVAEPQAESAAATAAKRASRSRSFSSSALSSGKARLVVFLHELEKNLEWSP